MIIITKESKLAACDLIVLWLTRIRDAGSTSEISRLILSQGSAVHVSMIATLLGVVRELLRNNPGGIDVVVKELEDYYDRRK